jgi:hypothetical protein
MNEDRYQDRDIYRPVGVGFTPKYTARNKKGKEIKSWQGKPNSIWNGRKR